MRARSAGSRRWVTPGALCALFASSAASPAQAATGGSGLAAPEIVGAAKFALAVATGLLLFVGAAYRRAGRASRHRRLRDGLLVAFGLLGLLAWSNFLQFHYLRGIAHAHDLYHYYMGAKYFEELRYTRLYDCTTVAQAEEGFGAIAAQRRIRNLTTYRLESAAVALRSPETCTAHFAPARWRTFRHDVGWFRERLDESSWRSILTDHGYNPSPVWTALGGLFLSDAPVDWRSLSRLLWIDPLLLLAMWVAVLRSFGWRTACVALVFWGTSVPGDFRWTGGAFLRDGWIATLVIGICCLRSRRMATAGALLATSSLLRVFPMLAIAGVALGAVVAMRRRRSFVLSEAHRRFALGCAVTSVVLVAFSVATAGGLRSWGEFIDKLALHSQTMFATNVGLKSALAYDYDTPLERALRPPGTAPNASAAGFVANYAGRRWLHAGIVIAYLLLLARAAGRCSDWDDAALGAGAVVLLATMSNYYYGVLVGFALIERRGDVIGISLCALAALTWCIEWGSGSYEQEYAWISLATAVFVIGATAWCGRAVVGSARPGADPPVRAAAGIRRGRRRRAGSPPASARAARGNGPSTGRVRVEGIPTAPG